MRVGGFESNHFDPRCQEHVVDAVSGLEAARIQVCDAVSQSEATDRGVSGPGPRLHVGDMQRLLDDLDTGRTAQSGEVPWGHVAIDGLRQTFEFADLGERAIILDPPAADLAGTR